MLYKESATFSSPRREHANQLRTYRKQWNLDPSIGLEEATDIAKELYAKMQNTAELLETHPLFYTLTEETVSLEIGPRVFIIGNESGLLIASFNEEVNGIGKKHIEFQRLLGDVPADNLPAHERAKQIFPLKNTLELSIHSDPLTQSQVEEAALHNEDIIDQLRTMYSFDQKGNFLKLSEIPEGIPDSRMNVLKETPEIRLVKSPLSKQDLVQAEKALEVFHYYLS